MLLTSLAAKARLNVLESQEVALARDSRGLLPKELLLEVDGVLKSGWKNVNYLNVLCFILKSIYVAFNEGRVRTHDQN